MGRNEARKQQNSQIKAEHTEKRLLSHFLSERLVPTTVKWRWEWRRRRRNGMERCVVWAYV